MKTHYTRNLVIVGIWTGYWLLSTASAAQQASIGSNDADPKVQTGSSMGQKLSDAATTARVKTQLILNDHTDGLRINVDTLDSEVTLNGTVRSETEKSMAEDIARNTDGVRNVQNHLKIASHDTSSDNMDDSQTGTPLMP